MDWNQYAKDIKQIDANVQAVVKGGKIMTADIGFSRTMHQQSYDRLERTGAMIRANGGGSSIGEQVLAVFYVDKGHRNGGELHWITDNGVIIVTNALRNGGLDICTKLNARPQQIRRYTQGGNPDWDACEQMFPDKDWKAPGWLLDKAAEHQKMGLNQMEESFMDTLKSGWKKIKKAFADRPEVELVGDDGKRKEIGYIHDYDKKRGICQLILKNEMNENVAAIAGAVAGALSARDGGDYRPKKKKFVQQFKKGDKGTLVGSDIGENIPVTVLGFETCADLKIYTLKLEI